MTAHHGHQNIEYNLKQEKPTTQRIRDVNDIIEVIETNPEVRRRVFETLGATRLYR